MTSPAGTGPSGGLESTTAVGSTNSSSGTKAYQQIPKAIVKNADMSEQMQQAAVDVAKEALQQFTVEKDIAAHVKKTMDSRFGATWHAVVGKNYGSYVTHETNHFIYFYLGSIAFLLWKA